MSIALPDLQVKWTNGTSPFGKGAGMVTPLTAFGFFIVIAIFAPCWAPTAGPRLVDPDRAGRQTLARSA